jgi:hypothetical protein
VSDLGEPQKHDAKQKKPTQKILFYEILCDSIFMKLQNKQI